MKVGCKFKVPCLFLNSSACRHQAQTKPMLLLRSLTHLPRRLRMCDRSS